MPSQGFNPYITVANDVSFLVLLNQLVNVKNNILGGIHAGVVFGLTNTFAQIGGTLYHITISFNSFFKVL